MALSSVVLQVQREDGGNFDANAYIDVTFYKRYHQNRGRDVSAQDTNLIKAGIVRATDYLDERWMFVGEKLQLDDQTTEWPRLNAFDIDDNYIDGIPREIKEACAEYALLAQTRLELFETPTCDPSGRVVQSRSETVGPLSESVMFTDGAAFELPKYPRADRKIVARGLVLRKGTLYRG